MTDQVVGFVRKLVATNEIVDEEPLALPPQRLETRAVWWTLPAQVIARAAVTPRQLAGAIHAAEHAAIGLLPLIATCDRWDVGGVSTPLHPDTGLTTIFVYDGYPGGAGISERGFRHDRAAARTRRSRRPRSARAPRGCPSCVAEPEVRQRQRAAGQAGRRRAARGDRSANAGAERGPLRYSARDEARTSP